MLAKNGQPLAHAETAEEKVGHSLHPAADSKVLEYSEDSNKSMFDISDHDFSDQTIEESGEDQQAKPNDADNK